MDDMKEHFIDIQDKKKIYLTKDQIETVKENPERLTKEGVAEHAKNWKQSKNRQVLAMYQVMLAKCEKFAKSGNTVDGRPIFSRTKDDKPDWVGPIPSNI